ncbi:myomegalin, partial [Lingula anatina]|uniref:Myomegalin n=1 Tax=Lingula anatina TaxID=7574 RepID=A0A1S3HGH0_LINAN
MDSVYEQDPTLPIDFDGSTNPDLLGEVTFGTHLKYPDGSVPMVEKASSGRMSPVRARTMKEYDQQLATLKKENFSLKLRIYYLEEQMKQRFGDHEDVFKTNIELKVEVESLKKDLMDKQELLKRASNAVEGMAYQHENELVRCRDQLEEKLKVTEQEAQKNAAALKEAQDKLKETQDRLKELEAVPSVDQSESNRAALGEKDKIIDQLRTALKNKDAFITELEREKEDAVVSMRVPLEEKVKLLSRDLKRKEDDIQSLVRRLSDHTPTAQVMKNYIDYQSLEDKLHDALNTGRSTPDSRDSQNTIDDQQRKIDELEIVCEQLTSDLQDKEQMIGKLEDGLRDKDKLSKELENQLHQLQKESKTEAENLQKSYKAVQSMVKTVHDKEKQIQQLTTLLEEKEDELEQNKQELHAATMKKYQGLEDQQLRLSDKDNKIAQMEGDIKIKDLENQKLQKSLARKVSEIERLQEQLEKLDEVIKHKEESVQDLQEKLHEEKEKGVDKLEAQEQQYQVLSDDAQRQLQSKEKVIQRLSKSLKEKDRQLQEYLDKEQSLTPKSESKDSLISKLRERLAERDKAVEEAIEEKFRALEEKDNEIRGLKMSLRERERDIERANQMLLNSEETIDTLEREGREKEQHLAQLASALKGQQQAMEEIGDKNVHSLEEKEGVIKRLQDSLASREVALQNALRDSAASKETIVEQLQQRLKEKDNLIEEIMADRSKAAVTNEEATRELLEKLRDKDGELKHLHESFNKDMATLNKELQQLQTELNRKDFELQSLENKATWAEEQQQEMLDKMRTALSEKDKTIESLVESAREKDKLFRQIHDSQPPSISPSKLAELHRLRDEVSRLKNDLQNKEDLIERLRMARNRSPKHSITYDSPDSESLNAELKLKEKALKDALQAHQQTKEELDQLKQQLSGGGVDVDELRRLRIEVVQLREEVDRPGTPQRQQITVGGEENLQQIYRSQVEETEGLNQALQAERQLYVNLNTVPSGRPEAFEEELAAVQALRRQLEEGVERNNHLRELLEKQMNEAAKKKQSSHHLEDNPEQVSSLQEQVQALNNQLEESKRWNVSLQSRLEQQQQRGGGVGRARDTVEIQGTENVVSTSNDSSDQSSSVSDSDNISDRELSVKQLREELAKMRLKVKEKRRHNKQLKYQLQQGMVEHRDIPGENVTDLDPVESTGVSSLPPGQQLEQLRAKLKQQGKENLVLRRCLDLDTELPVPNIPDLPKVKHMRNEMEKMKELLRQAEHQNDLLKKQIELDTSTDDIPSGFNPELIIQMSHEIERLKGELTATREKLEAAVEGKPSGKPPSGPHKSQIPTLKTPPAGQSTGANAALRQKVESLRGQLHENKVLLRTLQDKLAATEATVRSQTDKMRYYRGLLEDAGLMPRTPQRSRSDSNLFSGRVQTPTKLRPMSASTDNLSMGTSAGRDMPPPSPSLSRGMSLTSLEEFGQTDNTDELKDQIKQQRKQLERYQRIIRSLQTRIRLGSDTAEKVYLGSPLPGSRRGSSDGTAGGPPGLTPKTPGLDLVSQGNQAAFQRLQEQVEELKDKLRHSEDLNATLREQLSSSPSPEDINNTVQKQQLEIRSLKKQLSESYNMCENLRKRLEEVNGFLQELLHQDADGEVDVIDVTPTRVTDLKRKLCESINMATLLSTTLEAPFEEEEDEEEVNTTVPSTYAGTVPRSATAGSSNVGTGGTQTAGLPAVRGSSTQTDRMTMGSKSTQAGQQWTKMDGGDSRHLIEGLEQENNKLKEQVQVVEARERELKAEVQRLQSELQKRGQQLEQLKLLLQNNQEQAQQTGQELHRLGCEVEEKNKKIAKLQKIIDQLQKRPTDSNIPTEEREIWGPEGLDQYDLDQMDRSSPSTHAFPATRQGNLDRRGQGDLDDLDARSSGGSRRSADRHDGQRSLRGQQGSDRGQDWSSLSSSSGTVHNRKDVKSKQYRKSRKVGGGGAREVGPSVSSDSGDEQLRGSVKYRPGDVGDSLDIERLRHRSASGSHREPRLTGRTVEGSTVVEESGLSSSSLHSSRVSSLRQPSGDRTAASADSFSNRGQHDLQDRTGRHGRPYGDSSYAHNIFGSREDVIVDLRDTGHDDDGDLNGLEFRVTNGQLDQELFGQGHRHLVDPDLPTDHLQSQSRIFEGEGRDNRERDRRIESSRPSNSSSTHHSQRDGRSTNSSHRSGQRSSQGHRGQRAFEGHSYTSTAPPDSEKDKLIVNLQQKLKTVEELNETLKDEMKLFENIGTSVGIQSSPGMSTHGSQTRRDPHSTLQEHLNEIRELRKRLEESIRNNDLLREKLERRLEDMRREGGGGTTNVYLQQTETEVHELRQTVIEKEEWVRKLEKEMKELQNRCKALEKNNVELKQVNSDLDQANKQLEKTCQELQLVNTDLQKKNDQVNKQLTDSRQENKRLINDLNRAQQSVTYLEEQVQESQGLNKTLKMELNVFEKMREETREKGTGADFKLRDISGADMTDLFEEIRHLRVQLERSIEANNSLRQMLELSRDMGQGGSTSSVINIHHMHTRNTTNTKSTENREELLQRETSHPTGDQGNRYYSRDLYGEDAQRRTEEKIHPEVSHRTGDLGNRYHTYDLD